MMNYQSNGRNQRPKGFRFKLALQFALLLAVGIWLLYQIVHSHDEKKEYGGSIQNKLSEDILGRRGNAGWSNRGGDSDSEDVNLMGETDKKEDGGAGDDELDRNPEEKAEEESFIMENENIATHEGREDQKEPEIEYNELQTNEDNNGVEIVSLNKDMKEYSFNERYENALRNVTDHDEQGDEKDPEKIVKGPQNNEKDHNRTPTLDKDEAVKENDEDKDPKKTEEKFAVQPGGMVNATSPGQHEMEDGVHSFNDENGVPQDINDVVESMRTESGDDQKSNLHRETISSSNNQSGIAESMQIEGEEVKSKDAHVETESKGTLEDTKNDMTADAEIGSETNGASRINHASGKSIGSEDSHSVSSQKEQEEFTNISMLPQAE